VGGVCAAVCVFVCGVCVYVCGVSCSVYACLMCTSRCVCVCVVLIYVSRVCLRLCLVGETEIANVVILRACVWVCARVRRRCSGSVCKSFLSI